MDCLLACLSKKRLEVLHTIFVVETHSGNGRSDTHPRCFMPSRIDLFGAAAHKALTTAKVSVDVSIKQLHKQPVEFGVDKARLRQQFLRCRLVVRLRCWREVCLDLDAPTIAMAAAPMNRKALEVQEDLYPVLRKLNPQLLMAVRYGERCRTLLLPARSSRGVASLRSTRRCQSHLLATP